MKYASEYLVKEHKGILVGLQILEKMILLIRKDTLSDRKDIAEIIKFLKLFADKCHHGKEEGLLFPLMEKYGIPKEKGPIGQMLAEHDTGRELIRKMSDASSASEFNKTLFIESAENYIQLLRAHIEKENTILFPMGDKVIPAELQPALIEAFEKHEDEVMGKGTHEKLHEMLHLFSHKYLE